IVKSPSGRYATAFASRGSASAAKNPARARRLRQWFDGLAGGRSSVVHRMSRWRPAVFVDKTTHKSESLRMRCVGGNRRA
ncbi:hypothetical protein, partial [Catenulispora rubra]|uniref:hypothetical protein n=1 Tax=Catenulispora rubra TaxID=280293 RepID=UPI001E5C58AF